MKFTAGDWTWDVPMYGVPIVLISFAWTALMAQELLFAGLCLLALSANLYITWLHYVPMLREREVWDKGGEELSGVDRTSPEYIQAMQALKTRDREFEAAKRRERAAKSGQSENWLELRGK